MVATLSQSQADLPRLVEMASQGEEVLITVDGRPKAKLIRADAAPSVRSPADVQSWLGELQELRNAYSTGVQGSTVDEILDSDRADR